MATGQPAEPRWGDAPPAEKTFFRWAVEQLPDGVLVLPSVMLSIPGRGAPVERELDLVIIDPDAGVTVVEVKGGTVSFDAKRNVWRRAEASGVVVRDPVQQARSARSELSKALEQHRVTVADVAFRWAIALPECRSQAPGGTVLEDRQFWDAGVADTLGEAYRRLAVDR